MDFYADGVFVSSDSVSPYTASWTTSAAGSHTITAAAVDNLEVGEERDPELLTKLQSGAQRLTDDCRKHT